MTLGIEPNSLTLRQAAERLGVHYMTAYRYVRTGRLEATKIGAEYRIPTADVEALAADPPRARAQRALALSVGEERALAADYSRMLELRLLDADEPGAWTLIETATRAGASPAQIHIEMLIPALQRIGDRWDSGAITVRQEHQATAVATRLLARVGPRVRQRGASRGHILLGAVATDTHALPTGLMADLLRSERWQVTDLGGDTPTASFVELARQEGSSLHAIGIASSTPGNEALVTHAIMSIKQVSSVPVLVGGGAMTSEQHARSLGADGWAGTPGDALRLFAEAH